jgi:general secretion pathway protein J
MDMKAGWRQTGRGMSGFTLIEFLIALAILSIIAAVSYTSFVSVRKTIDVGRRNNELMREMRAFLERLDVELSGALYVKGDSGTLFLSKREDLGQQSASSLVFTTIMPQSPFELGKRGEVVRIEYVVAQSEAAEDLIVLKKRIYLYSLPPREFDEPLEFIIGEEFTSFLLRFKSTERWVDTWDTQTRNELPQSVELVFSLGGGKYRELFNIYIAEM